MKSCMSAPLIKLKRRGHMIDAQKKFPGFYQTELIGDLVPDMIVDDSVIVDPKVVTRFTEHVAQMIGYLIRNPRLDWKRVLCPRVGVDQWLLIFMHEFSSVTSVVPKWPC
jgi:PD-(D/E)XK nuclease superfamily protein